MFKINRKGQLTLFVILGIVIVGTILFFFIFRRPPSIDRGQSLDNPEDFLDSCVKDVIIKELDYQLERGGFESQNSILFEDKEINYLCKNINYYQPCVNQHPLLINEVKKNLEITSTEKIKDCLGILENEFKSKGYSFEGGIVSPEIEFKPGVVSVDIGSDLIITKGDYVKSFDNFKIFIKYPAYDLIFVASEIASQEASTCYFNVEGFMTLYREYDIKKFSAPNITEIYKIEYRDTKDVMNIATRGCVIPPGF